MQHHRKLSPDTTISQTAPCTYSKSIAGAVLKITNFHQGILRKLHYYSYNIHSKTTFEWPKVVFEGIFPRFWGGMQFGLMCVIGIKISQFVHLKSCVVTCVSDVINIFNKRQAIALQSTKTLIRPCREHKVCGIAYSSSFWVNHIISYPLSTSDTLLQMFGSYCKCILLEKVQIQFKVIERCSSKI